MLTTSDRKVIDEFAGRVRERFPEASVWAYGSRARGTGSEGSDFDVCVVIERLDQEADRLLSDIAWEVGFRHDRVISVIPFCRDEFERGPSSESGLVRAVAREGIPA